MIEKYAELPKLPQGWILTHLENLVVSPTNDIVDGPFGSDLKASEYVENGVPIIRLQNIERSRFINKNTRFIIPEKAKELERHGYKTGDIVITKLGDPLGKACIVPIEAGNGIIVADVVRIRIEHPFVSKYYLVNALNSVQVAKRLEEETKGTTRPRVNLSHIRSIELPLPPLSEQNRIVARIELLFARLDDGVETLKKIQLQLKRYRQSVLKSAFEGTLTAEWREIHKSELEPASVLMGKIKEEHKKNCNYKELPPLDMADLPELPDGWIWTRMGDSLSPVVKANPQVNPEKEFIYLDIASIDNKQQEITEPKRYIGKDAPSRARQLVQSGDILFSTVRTYLKNIAVVKPEYDGQVASTGFCVIRPSSLLVSEFAFFWVQTNFFLNPLNELQRGTSYPAVRDGDVFSQPIPLPSFPSNNKSLKRLNAVFQLPMKLTEPLSRV